MRRIRSEDIERIEVIRGPGAQRLGRQRCQCGQKHITTKVKERKVLVTARWVVSRARTGAVRYGRSMGIGVSIDLTKYIMRCVHGFGGAQGFGNGTSWGGFRATGVLSVRDDLCAEARVPWKEARRWTGLFCSPPQGRGLLGTFNDRHRDETEAMCGALQHRLFREVLYQRTVLRRGGQPK